jgi:hypothetical protein
VVASGSTGCFGVRENVNHGRDTAHVPRAKVTFENSGSLEH